MAFEPAIPGLVFREAVIPMTTDLSKSTHPGSTPHVLCKMLHELVVGASASACHDGMPRCSPVEQETWSFTILHRRAVTACLSEDR